MLTFQRTFRAIWTRRKLNGARLALLIDEFGLGILVAFITADLEDETLVYKWTNGMTTALAEVVKDSLDGEMLREFCGIIANFLRLLLYGEMTVDACVALLMEWRGEKEVIDGVSIPLQ
jgi:hypothetical protein